MGSKLQDLLAEGTSKPSPAQNGQGHFDWTSPAMQTLRSVVSEIARTNIPILLSGEVGTGKRSFARHIHGLSQQAEKPLVKISCAAMKAENLEAEFGLVRIGKGGGEAGLSGTILFDEISELEPACQRSLLCSLPDGDTTLRAGMITARL